MPAPSTAEPLVAKFQFLCHVPTALDPLQDDCAICTEPYRDNAWELGGTMHRPVTLPCGHDFGLQCLARWLLSAASVNNCPLCRRPIVVDSTSRVRERMDRPLVSAFARFETLAVVKSNGVSPSQRIRLFEDLEKELRREKLWLGAVDRIMVAWEELFNHTCNHSPERSYPLATQAVAPSPLRPNEIRLVLSKWHIQIALFLAAVGMAYVLTGWMWDRNNGRADSFTAAVLSLAMGSFSFLAFLAILALDYLDSPSDLSSGVFGALVGVLLAVAVRRVDLAIYESWNAGLVVVESRGDFW